MFVHVCAHAEHSRLSSYMWKHLKQQRHPVFRFTSIFESQGALMASKLNPAFAYTVVYVNDVAKSVDFYSRAFGVNVRRLDHSHRWGELETGTTTIAFTPARQHETDDITGTVKVVRSRGERGPIEVCFDYADVDAAYKRAVENGAEAVKEPEEKEWGQKVGYVRDIDGMVVRMGSHVHPPKET